ncbi:MLO protein homolog 1-like [Rhodamnia argentea]|uniref:MLO-like protein n=1 Tax=Rhodamnia argentea TaxID=178133 RepID=A0ABM3GXA0_9MYRT|nr:MLO protein homolog 1-like [Rhodamnia argentea]
MAPKAGDERSLKETPTWAVAVVSAMFIIISIVIEYGIHSLEKWFSKRHKKAMIEALVKIKSELMLLGFISLLITVGTQPISMVCIAEKYAKIMLPCKREDKGKLDKDKDPGNGRKLLWDDEDVLWRRSLAPGDTGGHCSKHGKVPLISTSGVHQLHIFIFVLAVFHVLYSVITICLAKAKMKKWKAWEEETTSLEYQFNNDPSRFRLTHQTSFVRRHSGLSTTPGIRWIVAFFRQFFGSVSKVDYLTMRHGFINAHLAPNSKFDFHKYIKRSMEDDFKVVVGISIPLWICCILFELSNVYGKTALCKPPSPTGILAINIEICTNRMIPLFILQTHLPYQSSLSYLILLLVGTKLELVIMEMAHQIQDKTTVVKGAPIVEPNNKYFWFNRPDFILFLIHLTLFQNAFQMSNFLWTWYEFGMNSCFHKRVVEVFTRVFLGVVLQFVCSYITFPLYALVTQMGSHMKKAIFEEQTARALKNWQRAARERKKQRQKEGDQSVSQHSGFMSPDQTPSRGSSPLHLLHKHNHNSSTNDLESVLNSPRSYTSETELSDYEGPPPPTHFPDHHHQQVPDQHGGRQDNNNGRHKGGDIQNDFSFSHG